jgi:molybdopterin/thiamine biosynthesis adenylyltransferase
MNKGTVLITEEAYTKLKELPIQSDKDGLETGVCLFGRRNFGRQNITHVIGPGPSAKRTHGSFELDYAYVASEYRALDPHGLVQQFGEAHVHPCDGLSAIDEAALFSVTKDFPNFLAVVIDSRSHAIRVFGVENDKIVEKTLEVVQDIPESLSFKRVEQLYDITVLGKKRIVVLGAGSMGSLVCVHAAYSGVGNVGIIDPEKLERHNCIRHIGTLDLVGKHKADITAEHMKRVYPGMTVETQKMTVDSTSVAELESIIKESDLVVVCTGTGIGEQIVNDLCVKHNITAVFAGVFERASGGMVFVMDSNKENSPCYNCLHNYSRGLQDTSNTTMKRMSDDYGVPLEDLSAQQGMYIDINHVAALQSKAMLLMLLEGSTHTLPALQGNLGIWDSTTLSSKWITSKKRADCFVCNREGFYVARPLKVESEKGANQ